MGLDIFATEKLKELSPQVSINGPRIYPDNGTRFIARDFKDFIRISGMTHVKTSPYYPESNPSSRV